MNETNHKGFLRTVARCLPAIWEGSCVTFVSGVLFSIVALCLVGGRLDNHSIENHLVESAAWLAATGLGIWEARRTWRRGRRATPADRDDSPRTSVVRGRWFYLTSWFLALAAVAVSLAANDSAKWVSILGARACTIRSLQEREELLALAHHYAGRSDALYTAALAVTALGIVAWLYSPCRGEPIPRSTVLRTAPLALLLLATLLFLVMV